MTRGIKVWLLAWVGTFHTCTAFSVALEPAVLMYSGYKDVITRVKKQPAWHSLHWGANVKSV